jgi:hypothetical protein
VQNIIGIEVQRRGKIKISIEFIKVKNKPKIDIFLLLFKFFFKWLQGLVAGTTI